MPRMGGGFLRVSGCKIKNRNQIDKLNHEEEGRLKQLRRRVETWEEEEEKKGVRGGRSWRRAGAGLTFSQTEYRRGAGTIQAQRKSTAPSY